MTKAGKEIMAGINDAIDYMRGGAQPFHAEGMGIREPVARRSSQGLPGGA